jgi:hypothetical protein
VPVVQVEDAIRAACVRWRVLEVAAHPYRWQRSLEVLDGDGLPVHEFFQNAARMGPATTTPEASLSRGRSPDRAARG